jgi:hypothetical protein
MARKISKTMADKLVAALADPNHEMVGAATNTERAMIERGLVRHQALRTRILDARGHLVRSHGLVLTEDGLAEARRLTDETAPAAPAAAPVKIRRGDLVMVEMRPTYTVGTTLARVEQPAEYRLFTVTNLTRDGKIKMVRDERVDAKYGAGSGYPQKFEGMLHRTGAYWLMPAADWDTAEAQRLAGAHVYPNSTTPRAFPTLEAARAALAPARRSPAPVAAPAASEPVAAPAAPAPLPEVPESAAPRSMMEAVSFLAGLKVGERVRVTREGRTADLTVSMGPRRCDGPFGSIESTHVTVSYGVGRYSFEVNAGHLFARKAGKMTTYGGTRMMRLGADAA